VIADNLIDHRAVVRCAGRLEKRETENKGGERGTGREDWPERKTLLFSSRFASQCCANVPPQMRRCTIGWRVIRQRSAQRQNLFLGSAAFVTTAQMLFDFARINQIKLAVSVGVKQFENIVVVHFRSESRI
jgi:hypothetical protein